MVFAPRQTAHTLQDALRTAVAQAARKGHLTLTQELMGYTLYAKSQLQQYAPAPSEEPSRLPVTSPEILTGKLENSKI